MAYYRTSVEEDCYILAPHMREQDKKEVKASNGLEPLESLILSLKYSEECNTAIHDDGSVIGMFGVADCGEFGGPWLLGSDRLLEIKKDFIMYSKEWVVETNKRYPILMNYVHADNTVAKRWLKSLGFVFLKRVEEYGVGKEPFYEFVRIA
jgi:hypothetical protein